MSAKTKKTLKIVLIVVLSVLLLGASGFGYWTWTQLEAANETIAEKTEILEANTQTVYVAKRDIKAAENLILEGENANIMEQNVYTGIESMFYIHAEDLENTPIASTDIPSNTPIQTNMVGYVKVDKDTREAEISVANIMTSQQEYDTVDVRIMFPNGEDYTVLSKKSVNNLQYDNCIWTTYLNEEELVRLASATIDAYTIAGTYIYTTKYVETNIQEAAKPNYYVREESIALMSADPNILSLATNTVNAKARRDLEIRLGNLTEDQLDAVTEGHNLADTAKGEVLTQRAEDQKQMLDNNTGLYVDYEDGSETKEDLTAMGTIKDPEATE